MQPQEVAMLRIMSGFRELFTARKVQLTLPSASPKVPKSWLTDSKRSCERADFAAKSVKMSSINRICDFIAKGVDDAKLHFL